MAAALALILTRTMTPRPQTTAKTSTIGRNTMAQVSDTPDMSDNTKLVTANNTAEENAIMARNPMSPALAAVIEEENERRARHLRKIARLNGDLV